MIRKFEISNIDKVIDIWLTASIKAHDFIDKSFWQSKVTDMREQYIPVSETYVYEENKEVIGFISLYNETISAIFISPDSQGKGIGSQLIQKAKEVRENLNLTVYKENKKSIEFYIKCGFKIEKEQIDAHTGHVELLMEFTT